MVTRTYRVREVRPGAWVLAAVVMLSALPGAAQAAQRVALVIGNGAYEKVKFLPNPGNDARAMGDAFERLGYAVTRLEDAGKEQIYRGLQDFRRAAGASDVAVVFYAGHGIEVDGSNFLVPVDAALAHDADVEYEAVPLDLVMRAVAGARRLGLVVLDACRDNPFVVKMQSAGATRSVGRGLARVAPSGGTLVAYAAEDGKTAADGDGRNSPYTEALLKYLERPGLDVGDMFRKVRDEVLRTTGGDQKPFEYGALPGQDVYLAGGPPRDETETVGGTTPPPPPPPPSEAKAAYEAAVAIGDIEAFRVVVDDFPGSTYAKLARVQIAKLEGRADPDDTAPPPPPPTPAEVENGLGLQYEERRWVQMGLASAGHDPGPADGAIGRGTRKALRGWQRGKGFEVTGYLTREQSESLVALGREEGERRRVEAQRKAREAEERRVAEAERKAREEEERRRLALKPGRKFRDCPDCPEMVVVPGGTTGRPFAVGVYEVTFDEWDACVSGGGCGGYRPIDRGWGRGSRPVIRVNWHDAKSYVAWLSRKTGAEYRLLSESEWEYVARAGTTTKYWWGNEIGRNRANCNGCGSRWDKRQTAPVGSFAANAFGLYDVHGNVWEWVEDCWDGDCRRRVLRGGSWDYGPGYLRSAIRLRYPTGLRGVSAGFRLARTLTP